MSAACPARSIIVVKLTTHKFKEQLRNRKMKNTIKQTTEQTKMPKN